MKKLAIEPTTERAVQGLDFDHGDDEPANHSRYQEYERGFDEIPILDDAVRIPPRQALPRNFVRGERPSLRRKERPDAYELRETGLTELEELYREYLSPQPVGAKRKAREKKNTGGKRRRKSAAVG